VRPGRQRQVLALEQRLARTSRTVMDGCRGESLATRPLPPQVAPPVNAERANHALNAALKLSLVRHHPPLCRGPTGLSAADRTSHVQVARVVAGCGAPGTDGMM
jgi:hypothetical protein